MGSAAGEATVARPSPPSPSSSSSAPPAATVDNLVLLTFAEAEAHERGELVGRLDSGVVERIERALERVRREFCGPTEMTA